MVITSIAHKDTEREISKFLLFLITKGEKKSMKCSKPTFNFCQRFLDLTVWKEKIVLSEWYV